MREFRKGEFTVSTDPALIELDVVHGFLTKSYWATGIPREVVARSIENSLCFGLYAQGKQIGFARVIPTMPPTLTPATCSYSNHFAVAAWANG